MVTPPPGDGRARLPLRRVLRPQGQRALVAGHRHHPDLDAPVHEHRHQEMTRGGGRYVYLVRYMARLRVDGGTMGDGLDAGDETRHTVLIFNSYEYPRAY